MQALFYAHGAPPPRAFLLRGHLRDRPDSDGVRRRTARPFRAVWYADDRSSLSMSTRHVIPSVHPRQDAHHLARSAGIVGAATMTSRVLGVGREQVLAYLFGAGREMDAFNVAFRVPNLLRDLFAEGAMSAAFVPAFTRELTRSPDRAPAWRMASSVMNALMLVTGAVAIAGILWAAPIVHTLGGGFAEVPGKLELTVMLTRILMPFLTLVAVAAVFMGMLNALNRFFVPSFAPAMFNVGMIGCALALVPLMPRLGWPDITGVAIGALVGGVLQMVVQWPALVREGFHYSPTLDLHHENVRRVFVLMGPGLIGIASVQLNLFVNTWLATTLGEGAVSWTNYAFRLVYLPIGLFGVSVATASLPSIAQAAALGDVAGMRQMVSRSLRLMTVLNLPAAAGLMALALPIVTLMFARGRFTTADAEATAAALVCFAPGLIGYCVIKLAVPVLYALGDSRTPALVSAAGVASNLAFSIGAAPTLGYRALAIGTSIGALVNGVLLLGALKGRLGGLDGTRVARTTMKTVIASVGMFIVVVASDRALAALVTSPALAAQVVRVGLSIAAGLGALALAARLLALAELNEAIAMTLRRLRAASR
jgi:putative peptidoglycan lipid II flippase